MKDRWAGLDKLLRDLRFGLRSLAPEPGICSTAILTLALGDGREHGGLQRDECGAAAVAAGSRSGSRWCICGPPTRRAAPARSIPTRRFPIPSTMRCASRAGGFSPVMAYVPLSGSKVAVRYRRGAGRGGRRHGERHIFLRPGREAAARPRLQRAGRDEPCADCRDQLQLLDAPICARSRMCWERRCT